MTLSQPRQTQTPPIGLHRFACAVAAMTVALITAGALVTSTGSGDAIPDWPTSYGALVPSYLAGGVLVEWAHRLVAGVTALLIMVLAVWLAVSPVPRWLKSLGGIALLAVFAQAVLGGLRVLVVSHPQVQAAALQVTGAPHSEVVRVAFAVAHAILAQIVLSLAFSIALFTDPAFQREGACPIGRSHRCSTIAFFLVILLFVQLLLGAVMRHTGAGLVIPDFPTSFGKIVPPFGNLPFDPNNPERLTYGAFAFKVAVHFAHRLNALLIGLVIGGLFWWVHRCVLGTKDGGRGTTVRHALLRRWTSWLLGLVLAQIALGGLSIWTHLAVPVTVAHVAVGATLLGLSVVTFWCTASLSGRGTQDAGRGSVGLQVRQG